MSRPRKATYRELADEIERLRSDNGAMVVAINGLVPESGFVFFRGKAGYSARMVGARRADGGIVIVTYNPGTQQPFSTAYWTEKWLGEEMERLKHLAFDKDPLAVAYRELVYRVNEGYRRAQRAEDEAQIPSMVLGQLCSMCQQGTTRAANCEVCGGTYCPHMIRDHACKAAKAAGE